MLVVAVTLPELLVRVYNKMFQIFVGYTSVLAVAALYYTWRDGYVGKQPKRAALNERVAYLLWVAANRNS